MFKLLVIIWFSAINAYRGRDQSVDRMNHGIRFNYQQTIQPVTAIWRHTMAIKLPGEQFVVGVSKTSNDTFDLSLPEITVTAYQPCHVTSYQTTNEDCMPTGKYARNIRYLQTTVHEGLSYLHQLTTAIYDLLPSSELLISDGKDKRALLGFVGQIFKGLFGTSTEADYQTLANHVKEIAETQNNEMKAIKKYTTSMSSFVQTSNKRMDALASAVQDQAWQNVKLIEATTLSLENEIENFNNLTFYTLKLEHTMSLLQLQYKSILDSIELLLQGYIPSVLVPQHILTKTLQSIQDSLISTHARYHIVYTDPKYYYQRGQYVFVHHKRVLYSTPQIPLTSFQEPFFVYEIAQHPQPMPNNKDHATYLENLPSGIVIDASQTHYYTLTAAEVRDIGIRHHSSPKQIFTLTKAKTCIIAIYQDAQSDIEQYCNYQIKTNSLQPSINHITKSSYLLTNINNYLLECPNKAQMMEGCQSCVIHIKTNCSLRHSMFYIPPTMDEAHDNASYDQNHVTNLPVLFKFFDAETLSLLKGDSKLLSPPQIQIPNFTYFEHQSTKALAKQNQLRLDLTKVVEAVKQDKVIVDNLAQSLVLGDVKLDTEFWFTSQGITLLVTWMVIFLLLLNSLYIFYQFRKITMIILLLKEKVAPTAAQTPPLAFIYTKPTQDPTQDLPLSFHQTIVQYQDQYWPYVVIGVLATLIAVVLLSKIRKRLKKQCNLKNYCYLALQMERESTEIVVKLLKLHGDPQNYVLGSNTFAPIMAVRGFWKPCLCVSGNAIRVEHTLTKQHTQVPQEIPITCLTAYFIRHILSKQHTINPIWIKANHRFHITTNP